MLRDCDLQPAIPRGFQLMLQLRSHTAEAYMDTIARIGGRVSNHVCWRSAQLPQESGKGVWEHYSLQRGLGFAISRYQLERPLSVEFLPEKPMFCFGSLLEGRFDVSAGKRRSVSTVTRGHGLNMWVREGRYTFQIHSGCYTTLSIIAEPDFLLEKLDAATLLPPNIEKAITSDCFFGHVQTNALSPACYEASRRALASSPADPFHSLLLESCALTILREQLLATWSPERGTRSLSRRDSERVYAARDLLLQEPERSPRLAELAHRVGINEFSLKRGFRLHFGLSVYEFLRKHRLEIADQLLASGEYSVMEIAQAVGYRSRGRFADAFRKQFGHTPKRRQMGLQFQRLRRESTSEEK